MCSCAKPPVYIYLRNRPPAYDNSAWYIFRIAIYNSTIGDWHVSFDWPPRGPEITGRILRLYNLRCVFQLQRLAVTSLILNLFSNHYQPYNSHLKTTDGSSCAFWDLQTTFLLSNMPSILTRALDIWTRCKACSHPKIKDHSWTPGHKLELGRQK